MKWEDYNKWVTSIWQDWPEKHAWVYVKPNEWKHLGHYDQDLQSFNSDFGLSGTLGWNYGSPLYSDGEGFHKVWFTPSTDMDPHEWRMAAYHPSASVHHSAQAPQVPASPRTQQPTRGATASSQGIPTGATRGGGKERWDGHRWVSTAPANQRPATATGTRRSASDSRRPVAAVAQQWVARGTPSHAYLGARDLGLLVNDHQVVQPTNGGRLWALYNLSTDGRLTFVDRYGSVPGAPPPPNAALNKRPEQFYPPPAQTPPTPPQAAYPTPYPDPYADMYADPYTTAFASADPTSAQYGYQPPPAYVPSAVYGYAQLPAYQPPPAYLPPSMYGYADPYASVAYQPPSAVPAMSPNAMDPATAAYLGAQYGIAEAVAELSAADPYAADPYAADPYAQVEPNAYAALYGLG